MDELRQARLEVIRQNLENQKLEEKLWELLQAIGEACDQLRNNKYPFCVGTALALLSTGEQMYLDEYDGGEE